LKILVLTSRFPYPLEKGDKLRIYNQLKILSQHHQVILVSLAEKQPSASHLAEIESIVYKSHVFYLSQFKRFTSVISGYLKKKPFRNAYFYNKRVKSEIDKIIATEKPEHIYCHLIRMADYIKDSTLPKTLDYMDCFSAGAEKRKSTSKGAKAWFYNKEQKLTLRYEREIYKSFDNHFIISDQDRKVLPLAETQKVKLLGNGIDLDFFKPQEATKKYDIGFIGNLGYYSNVYGSVYMAEKILPLLDKKIKIILAGARPSSRVVNLANDNIHVAGWVEDIRDAYASIRVFVAPLFKGIGQQNKILEAMAMGIPVVTTQQVNNAIGATSEKEILIAESPEAFATQINKLLSDKELYNRLQSNALNFVSSNYSWQEATQPLLDILEKQEIS
jgi:sugar transferase (PEP-CTERM/EpsH1 system associated)